MGRVGVRLQHGQGWESLRQRRAAALHTVFVGGRRIGFGREAKFTYLPIL